MGKEIIIDELKYLFWNCPMAWYSGFLLGVDSKQGLGDS